MSEYSDFYACSTKLVHFIPYKLQKAFSPPTAIIFHQSSGFVVTAVGTKILKYDIATGSFLGYFTDLDEADITALCEDGLRGRRLLCGNEKGKYYLINFTDGSVIDELKVHTKGIVNEMKIHTMEVTKHNHNHRHKHTKQLQSQAPICLPFIIILQHDTPSFHLCHFPPPPPQVTSLLCRRKGDRTIIYSSSVDGSIALCEEVHGRLFCRCLMDHAFGPKIGVKNLQHCPTLGVIVATSNKTFWGVWCDTSLRKILCIREKSVVHAVAVIGCSRDAEGE